MSNVLRWISTDLELLPNDRIQNDIIIVLIVSIDMI
jgi:hypothetical protein